MKKGMTPELLVKIVALVAAFLVLLVIVYPVIRNIIVGQGEKGQCQFSLLVSGVSQRNIIKLTSGEIPPECKTKLRTITKNDLTPYLPLAKQAIQKYNQGTQPYDVGQYTPTDYGYNKWALQKLVSDEMVACYEKTSRGSSTVVNGLVSSLVGYTGLPNYGGNAFACILCTRLVLDPEVQTLLTPDKEISVWNWLQTNNIHGMSYADYLMNNEPKQFYSDWLKATSTLKTDQPYVVGFMAKTTYGSGAANVGSVGLYPYNALTSDLSTNLPPNALETLNLRRASIVGITAPPSRCAVIIGD